MKVEEGGREVGKWGGGGGGETNLVVFFQEECSILLRGASNLAYQNDACRKWGMTRGDAC